VVVAPSFKVVEPALDATVPTLGAMAMLVAPVTFQLSVEVPLAGMVVALAVKELMAGVA
jgi:hypothetical protein